MQAQQADQEALARVTDLRSLNQFSDQRENCAKEPGADGGWHEQDSSFYPQTMFAILFLKGLYQSCLSFGCFS